MNATICTGSDIMGYDDMAMGLVIGITDPAFIENVPIEAVTIGDVGVIS